MSRIATEEPTPGDSSPIQGFLADLHARILERREGTVANYIPELAKANPDWFGICIVTADGHVYEVGDTRVLFTLQSISKPFAYGAALEDNGVAAMMDKVWMEPSGEAFNAISLRPETGQPANPMINAGAIATTSLLEGRTAHFKLNRILDAFARYAGHPLEIDHATYRSESETGHRNRAIAYMLRNFDIINGDPLPSLEAYFMQCSILVTCRDLAVMAATLANGGVNPLTGKRAVMADYVQHILSVMATCGMYDAAGEWIYDVGMPAKSGVSGGILSVLPGQLGIGMFSPPLDDHGNSVRGIQACRELSSHFDLHMFHIARSSKTVIRRTYHGGEAGSNRLRSAEETLVLRDCGAKLAVVELQGELVFSSMEVVVREVVKRRDQIDLLILDFTHIQAMDISAHRLLAQLTELLHASGLRLFFARTHHIGSFKRFLNRGLPKEIFATLDFFDSTDLALERCENHLLEKYGTRRPSIQRIDLAECELLAGLSHSEITRLRDVVQPRTFAEGEIIIREGDPPAGMFFLLLGKASVWLHLANGQEKRLATFSPGMTFGEMALLDRSPRSAAVRADQPVECAMLSLDDFDTISRDHGNIPTAIYRNLARVLSRRVRKSNLQLSALDQ